MWKNKHVVAALLVAPALAIIAWFAVDRLVSERPQAARPGASYPLVAGSGCRYASGRCALANGDVRLTLSAVRVQADGTRLRLVSALTLRDARVAVARPTGDQSPPVDFVADDERALSWGAELGEPIGAGDSLRVVVTAGDSRYFAEVPGIFLEREPRGTR